MPEPKAKPKCAECGGSADIENRGGKIFCWPCAEKFNYCEICGTTVQKMGDDPDIDQLHFEEECFK